jgi:hypothetical protein
MHKVVEQVESIEFSHAVNSVRDQAVTNHQNERSTIVDRYSTLSARISALITVASSSEIDRF